MFEALLLVCLSVSPDTCRELSDTKGPYSTFEQCKVRVDEMAEFTVSANLFQLEIKWQCNELTSSDTEKKGINTSTGTIPRIAI
tara:strand:- start:15 stop:266 length:252 start_codon:yes stop_codon:yes gene_type:complete